MAGAASPRASPHVSSRKFEPEQLKLTEIAAGRLREADPLFTSQAFPARVAAGIIYVFGQITKAAGLGEQWTPRELRHSFGSILSASDVPLEDISQLIGHVSTNVTEAVYRHEIRPALTKGAAAMDKIFGKAPGSG